MTTALSLRPPIGGHRDCPHQRPLSLLPALSGQIAKGRGAVRPWGPRHFKVCLPTASETPHSQVDVTIFQMHVDAVAMLKVPIHLKALLNSR